MPLVRRCVAGARRVALKFEVPASEERQSQFAAACAEIRSPEAGGGVGPRECDLG